MSGRFAWINGRIAELRGIRISPFDYGFLYGFGLFETIRAYRGRPFLLKEHLRRLNGSLEELGISLRLSPKEVEAAIAELLRANELEGADARIRLTVTPGEGEPVGDLKTCRLPTVLITASSIPPDLDERIESGVKLVTYPHPRSMTGGMARMKLISYVENLLARGYARERGAFEALFVDREGNPLEGATSNLFLLRGRSLITPPVDMGLLPGVTRAEVMRMARGMGFEVEERRVAYEELFDSDGVFLTNSVIEIAPVIEIDGRGVPKSEVVTRLRNLYRRRALGWPFPPGQRAGSCPS